MQSSAVCFLCSSSFLLISCASFSLCLGTAGICFVCGNEIPGGIAPGASEACLGSDSQKEQAALGILSWVMHNKREEVPKSGKSKEKVSPQKKSEQRAGRTRKD